MAQKYNNLNDLFGDIAKAIRNKTGKPGTIKADDFPAEIGKIQTETIEISSITQSYTNYGKVTFTGSLNNTILRGSIVPDADTKYVMVTCDCFGLGTADSLLGSGFAIIGIDGTVIASDANGVVGLPAASIQTTRIQAEVNITKDSTVISQLAMLSIYELG